MDTAQQLFALVELLLSERPFQREKVAAATQTVPEVADRRSNRYFIVWEADDSGLELLAGVEVRVPTRDNDARDGLVLLTIAEEAGAEVTQADVMRKYGSDPEVHPADPKAPPSAPVFLAYPCDWGTLRFGFSRTTPERLVKVVLDAVGS